MEYVGEWQLLDMEETGSTNDEVYAQTRELTGEKIVVSAQRQTNGRGRRGRSWIDLAGNLFFSLGLEGELNDYGALVFISSLSIWRTIRDLNPIPDVKLKWPNDVLVNDKKICGILLEKGEGRYVIIGIGVNIASAPLLLTSLYSSTSLSAEGIEVDRMDFLRSFMAVFDEYLNQWQTKGFAHIREEWLSHVKGLNEKITVRLENSEEEGIFRGVDEHGSLLLETAEGIQKIHAGDVFYRKGNK